MHTIRRTLTAQAAVLIALAQLTARGGDAQATNFNTLYSFQGGADGATPNGLALKEGALYGTTNTGGANNCGINSSYLCGTVFVLSHSAGSSSWKKTVLYSFNGTDGAAPRAGLVFDSAGTFYGTTETEGTGGGLNGGGTVFELIPPAMAGGAWTETVLYAFDDSPYSPHTPRGGVLLGPNGTLYTTTQNTELVSDGTVFMLAPPAEPGGNWIGNLVLGFSASGVGAYPQATVVWRDGSLYGTTYFSSYEGQGGCGSVYEATPPASQPGSWTATVIHNFGGPDGCGSMAPLTVGPDGVLYGTTYYGGSGGLPCSYPNGIGPPSEGCGTVFQLTPPEAPDGAWTETTIYNFTALNGDGAFPAAGLVMDENGVLYGTTTYGGSATSGSPCFYFGPTGCGTVFALTPPATPGGAWTETVLHSFTGQNGEGSVPMTGLTLNPTGSLFGTTSTGGTAGKGTVFAVKP
jgi:uncharacterized repeat protein (TIGR03803 family)